MAGRKQQRPRDQLDISQILKQAQERWLYPDEVYEILRNHTKISLSAEHADTPRGGSLFLYDKNVLKSFRKDGYKWKKTKNGKAMKEAHERLKVGGEEALHCYYAHGEENPNFQRRCYWMIEKSLSHIVLVHYLDIKTSDCISCPSELSINPDMHLDTTYHASKCFPGAINPDELRGSLALPCDMDLIKQNEPSLSWCSDDNNDPRILKNLDSSKQSMNTELGDLSEPQMSSYKDHLNPMISEKEIDGSSFLQQVKVATLESSLSHDHLFNIIEISPNWACERSEYEDVESAFCNQASSRLQLMAGKINSEFSAFSNIQEILRESKHRWLRPIEICEILQNYKKFHISTEPANTPPGGSVFLFDRKVLRYFRKDGHNWRKKKDGKTVKEAHERLKVGSGDALHCYYVHGEENENFQRRSYWLLEEDLSNIVLVHYLEVQGNRTNFNHVTQTESAAYYNGVVQSACQPQRENPVSSNFNSNSYQMHSQATETTSLSSAQASEYEDVESVFYNKASSRLQPMAGKINSEFSDAYYPAFSIIIDDYQEKLPTIQGVDFSSLSQAYNVDGNIHAGITYEPRKDGDFAVWGDMENGVSGVQSFLPSFSATNYDTIGSFPQQQLERSRHLYTDSYDKRQVYGIENSPEVQQSWQSLQSHALHSDGANATDFMKSLEPSPLNPDKQDDLQFHLSNTDSISRMNGITEGKSNHPFSMKPLLEGSLGDGLKKLDSFNRWMSNELEDVYKPQLQSSSGAYWDAVENENEVDGSSVPLQVRSDSYMLGPSLPQDQLFSIVEFSPSWAYENSQINVLIMGRFLKSQHAEICKWSCMFGEIEVPAEVIADDLLSCNTPIHKAGRVPFYVTCSNRFACSEVREFEYRVAITEDVDCKDYYSDFSNEALIERFVKLLSSSSTSPNCDPASTADNSELNREITSLLKNDNEEWDKMLQLTSDEDFSLQRVEEQLHEQLLKEKLHAWLLQKLADGGKGPNVLDEGGQGVLHFGAALGYDWVLMPTIIAGVSVNFRDVNGWTALHWAAFCGRERTVASLLALDAAPGPLTDPTTQYPSGETPADLASEQGHKGIAGYLAESALSKHLETLNMNLKDGSSAEISGAKTVSDSSRDGELTDGHSLRNSLTAVCNATQAAASIHQVFRVQSFQRKQWKEYDNDKIGMSNERALSQKIIPRWRRKGHGLRSFKPEAVTKGSSMQASFSKDDVDALLKEGKKQSEDKIGMPNERALSLIAVKSNKRRDEGRKDFLILRQLIVKIQAHVRGHQVRKSYRKIVWAVGIIEKNFLCWRRKGCGLQGFKPEAVTDGSSIQVSSAKDDDDALLKEGRNQLEERVQKELDRMKSMAQSLEARHQYRLLNVVTEIQETKAMDNTEETSAYMDDDLADIKALLGDDFFMPTASPP